MGIFTFTGAAMLVLNARMEGMSISRRVDIRDTRDRDTLRSVILTLRPWTQASLEPLEKIHYIHINFIKKLETKQHIKMLNSKVQHEKKELSKKFYE